MIATVLKIKKKFRNSEEELFLVILDKFTEDSEVLEELVEQRCLQHGKHNNPSFSWSYKILDKSDKDYKIAITQEIDKYLNKMVEQNQVINTLQRLL